MLLKPSHKVKYLFGYSILPYGDLYMTTWFSEIPSFSHNTNKETEKQKKASYTDMHIQFLNESIKRYRFIEILGRGGMGIVYKVFDSVLSRTVALKILNISKDISDSILKRFLREAKITAKLSHPHIVTLYEVNHQEDIPFFTMEYIEGETLQEYIKNDIPQKETALHIISQIIEALEYAHSKRIIHRDLKPSNIMITDTLQVKVMDFGIAKFALESESITAQGSVLGTIPYMPPEQVEGETKEIDEQSDIYALGCIFYELFTGKPVVKGDSPGKIIAQILKGKIEFSPECTIAKPLKKICLKALAKDKKKRYTSISLLKKDLEQIHIQKEKNKKKWRYSIFCIPLFIILSLLFSMETKILLFINHFM